MKFKIKNFESRSKLIYIYATFILIVLILNIKCKPNLFPSSENFRTLKHKKCSHHKKTYQKKYINNFNFASRKTFSNYYNEIPFEKMRIHFDYTFTLPYEEKILKELIIPPVQSFYENTLSVRRFPGKLRIPKNMDECQNIRFPFHFMEDGVDADLLIIITTYRGLKKYNYEKLLGINNLIETKENNKDLFKYFDNFLKHKSQTIKPQNNEFVAKSNENLLTNDYELQKLNSTSNNTSLNQSNIFQNFTRYNNYTSLKSNQTYSNYTKFPSQNSQSSKNETILPWEINDGPSDVVGWSSYCLQDLYTLRPVAGVMQYIADLDPSPRSIEEAVWTTLHEFAHILGMDYDLFSDFIDSNMERRGYEGTIKIKSKLKGLEEIINNRSDYFDDLYMFATNGGKILNNQTKTTNNETVKNFIKKNSKGLFDAIKFSQVNLAKSNDNINNQNKLENLFNHRKTFNSIISISKKSSNSKKIDTSKDNVEEKNSINNNLSDLKNFYIKRNKPFSNLKSDTYENQNNFKFLKSNSTSSKNSQNSTTNISQTSNITFDENEFDLELKYNFTQITLPELDEYIEINFPNNINITTLLLYIKNFSENTRVYIKTKKVISVGKTHFNCKIMDGVELEHFGGLGSAYSHWSKRILNTEFMIADSYGENYVSNFTLALFEDSGWYKVDYSKSERLPWGRKKGCSFLNDNCIQKKKIKKPFLAKLRTNEEKKTNEKTMRVFDTKFKDEFCLSKEQEQCSISKIFRAFCSLGKSNLMDIPKQYQYFDDPKISGGSYFGDYCPYAVEWTNQHSSEPIGSCRNGIALRPELGEKICENCRCFISSLVDANLYEKEIQKLEEMSFIKVENLNNRQNLDSDNSNVLADYINTLDENRAMCYEARCRIEKSKVFLYIYIGYQEIKCPRQGGILSIEGYKGYIECPNVENVCNGVLDPYLDYTHTSAYNLFSNLPQKLLNLVYEFMLKIYKK